MRRHNLCALIQHPKRTARFVNIGMLDWRINLTRCMGPSEQHSVFAWELVNSHIKYSRTSPTYAMHDQNLDPYPANKNIKNRTPGKPTQWNIIATRPSQCHGRCEISQFATVCWQTRMRLRRPYVSISNSPWDTRFRHRRSIIHLCKSLACKLAPLERYLLSAAFPE